MAYIMDSQKLDLLWKKIQFGVSQTDTDKSPYEELTKSSDQIKASDIWQDDDLIPAPASAVPGTVELVDIRMVSEPSVTDGTAWVAVRTYGLGITPSNRLRDFISPKFDPSYEIRVYSDDQKQNPIFNSSIETNWVFDYSSGILWFPEASTVSDLPAVYVVGYRYVGPKGLPATFSGDVIDVLTDLTDGTFEGGYVEGWVENETKISDAIDQLNRALLDFIPKAPVQLSQLYLELPGSVNLIDNANVVLATGFANNTSGMGFVPSPGQIVEKVAGINLETNYVGPFGNGDSGTLSVELNNAQAGFVVLGSGDNSGIYGNLDLNQDNSTNGSNMTFFETLTARAVNLNLPLGLNGLSLKHTETGSTNTLWLVRDSSNVVPTTTAVSVSEIAGNVLTYSSGIPHYTRGSRLSVGATVENLATDIYLDSRNIEFQTTPRAAGPTIWSFPNAHGLPAVLTKGETYTSSNAIYTITDYDGTMDYGSVVFKVVARNTNGKTTFTDTKRVNYMRGGTPTGISPIDELNVPVDNLGTFEPGFSLFAKRIPLGSGLTPAATFMAGTLPVWDPTDEKPIHEAGVIGGTARVVRENLASHLPAGPDYSSHDATQFITFAIQRKHVSQFLIEVEGRYSDMWVKLLGVNGFTRAPNGWLNCSKNYEGWGVPGRDVGDGCAVGLAAFGGSQTVHVTFGPESSSNATDNIILVRFRLTGTNAITGLRFSGVEQ